MSIKATIAESVAERSRSMSQQKCIEATNILTTTKFTPNISNIQLIYHRNIREVSN